MGGLIERGPNRAFTQTSHAEVTSVDDPGHAHTPREAAECSIKDVLHQSKGFAAIFEHGVRRVRHSQSHGNGNSPSNQRHELFQEKHPRLSIYYLFILLLIYHLQQAGP